MSNWKPIETYQEASARHARGVWVYNSRTAQPMYFQSDIGWINDQGDFVNDSGDFGWEASDYTHWMPIDIPPVPK